MAINLVDTIEVNFYAQLVIYLFPSSLALVYLFSFSEGSNLW